MERGNNKVKFSNNTDKGINILGQFYQELASGTPLIVSSAKPSSTKLNLNKIDESKLTSNTSKQIYKIMKTMYDKGYFYQQLLVMIIIHIVLIHIVIFLDQMLLQILLLQDYQTIVTNIFVIFVVYHILCIFKLMELI